MARNESEFSKLMGQIRMGSETAWREMVDKYGEHLLRVVRRRLNKTMRSKFDSQDFVQAVWASFLAVRPEPEKFDGPDDLVAFLSGIARNKVIEAVRQRLMTVSYDVNRETTLEETDKTRGALTSPLPGPESIAIAEEEWQQLVRKQPIQNRRIVEMIYRGELPRKVARRLRITEKTVRRAMLRLEFTARVR